MTLAEKRADPRRRLAAKTLRGMRRLAYRLRRSLPDETRAAHHVRLMLNHARFMFGIQGVGTYRIGDRTVGTPRHGAA